MVLSNSTMAAAGFHRVARLLQEMDYPSFGGRGEDGKSLRNCLATPQPGDLVGDRAHFRRLDANADVGLLLLALLFRSGLATVATAQQAEQEEEVCPVSVDVASRTDRLEVQGVWDSKYIGAMCTSGRHDHGYIVVVGLT